MESPPKKRGRPLGSRNKKPPPLAPHSAVPFEDYRHADPDALIARQLTMLDWAQQAVRNEMKSAFQSKGTHIDERDIKKLETLSNTLFRTIESMKKAHDVAKILSGLLSPAQALEAALKKIEGQDTATINAAIKRLREYRGAIAPVKGIDVMQMGDVSAAKALASLENE